jgi:hypothetical protein
MQQWSLAHELCYDLGSPRPQGIDLIALEWQPMIERNLWWVVVGGGVSGRPGLTIIGDDEIYTPKLDALAESRCGVC